MLTHIELDEILSCEGNYAGIVLGKDEGSDYHLILLPNEIPEINWIDANVWATNCGGYLPNRRELSLMFANLRDHFSHNWYWSSEHKVGRANLAWGQNFKSGIQTTYGRSYRAYARVVRRLQIK